VWLVRTNERWLAAFWRHISQPFAKAALTKLRGTSAKLNRVIRTEGRKAKLHCPIVFIAERQNVRAHWSSLASGRSVPIGSSGMIYAEVAARHGRITRSITHTSRSGSSLFIRYSSTSHRIRSGMSAYAESRMIGKLGNRCLICQATASASMPSRLYSSKTADTDVSSNIFSAA
jgi:hypothetical protein